MAKKKPAPAAPAPRPEAPRVLVREGFGSSNLREHCSNLYLAEAPSFVNYPKLYRVRVTVELVEEPKEVLAARLLELWETTPRNHHHDITFRALADEFGVVLNNETRATRAPRRS